MSDAFAAYQTFLALSRHFKTGSTYNYHQYNGKVKVNFEKFMQRKDRFHFYKLSKLDDMEGRIIAVLIKDESAWITDIFGQEAEEAYKSWIKRTQSMTYNFSLEVMALDTEFKELVQIVDGQYPLLLKKYQRGEVSMETLILFDECTDVFRVWEGKIKDDVLWPTMLNRFRKYRSFLPKHDVSKLLKAMTDRFKNG